ncbi:MAG: radical SAM protein [Candidatus Hecatellales archaeon]|nr:MAG: radical SAM protein [Candidatus Hecatellales archaeon]
MFWGKPILQVEPTTACNLNCEICMRSWLKRPNGFMSTEGFRRLVDLNRPAYVGFHGWGEPLLHNQICEMIAYAASRHATTSLITNGTLIDEGKASKLIDAGLKELAFGVYRLSRLQEISDKIALIVKLKQKLRVKHPKIFLDITVYRDNAGEIPHIVREAVKMGVEAVNIHRLFNHHNPKFKVLDEDEEETLFRRLKGLADSMGFDLLLPKKHSIPCRVAKYCIYVTWDFKVTPCCFLPTLNLANALETKISSIVKSKAYREFLANMSRHEVCRKCII